MPALSTVDPWERRNERIFAVVPYVLLALPTAISLTAPGQDPSTRLTTAVLAALAAGWLSLTHTRPHLTWVDAAGRRPPLRLALPHFVGLLVLGAVLTLHDFVFVLFLITGFFHAFLLPTPLALVGVLLTSILVNTLPAGFPPPPMPLQGVLLWLGIIAVQTLLIGWTTWMGLRGTVQSEQRRQAVTELQAALEENAALHAQLVTQAREAGVTQERQRLAHEMHDTLAQGLTGIITQLEAAGQAARAIPDPSPGRPELGRYLDNAARLARDSLTEARRSVNALRPEPLEDARLPEALAEVASRWSAVHGVAADVVTTGEARPMHPEVEITLLRTAQEALANVAKHAGATRVGLTLSYMEDLVTLDVRDDGVGFDPAAPPRNGDREAGGFGLTVMRQRVQHLDGTLEIESEPGAGTAIWAGLPAIARDGADA